MAVRREHWAILGSLLVCAAKAGGFVADYRASYRKEAAEDGCNRMVGRSKNIKSRLNQHKAPKIPAFQINGLGGSDDAGALRASVGLSL